VLHTHLTMPSVVQEPNVQGRLLLVSNRLPITIKRSDDGSYAFSMSSGGLVSGLSGLSKTTTFVWYGWPGLEVPEAEAGPMIQKLHDEYGSVPVFIDDDLSERHYNGFSSRLGTKRLLTIADKLHRFYPLAPLPLPPR
jgi:trehalose 6-phosphate synthase